MSMYGKYPVNADGSEKRPNPVTDFKGDKGFTVQADRDEADINKIISRFQKSGQLPPSLRGEPFYGDVSEFSDLAGSLMKIQDANALFMEYPAALRERFDNDPVKLVDFLADPKNLDEAVILGLAVAKPAAAPASPPAAAPAVSPTK